MEIPDLKPPHAFGIPIVSIPPCLRISSSENLPLPSEFREAVRGMVWNPLFCTLNIWQDFIRVVVLHLLSHGTNFHSTNTAEIIHKTALSIAATTNKLDSSTCSLLSTGLPNQQALRHQYIHLRL